MKKIFIGVFILIAVGILAGVYLYNKPHKSITASNTDYSIAANQLFKEFTENEAEANKKFLDKIIEVTGTIKEVSPGGAISTILLEAEGEMFGVLCSFDKPLEAPPETGQKVVVKGLCTGMLTDVVLIKCSIKENNL